MTLEVTTMTRQPRPDQPAYDEGLEAGIRFAHESMGAKTEVRAALEAWLARRNREWSGPSDWTAEDGYNAAMDEVRHILNGLPWAPGAPRATPATGPDEAFEAYAERGRNPNSKASANPLRDAFMAGWSSALDMGRLADALKATYRSQYRERDAEHVVRALATPATGLDVDIACGDPEQRYIDDALLIGLARDVTHAQEMGIEDDLAEALVGLRAALAREAPE